MLRKHKKRVKGSVADNTMTKTQGVREARYRKARKLLKNAIAKVRRILLFLLNFYEVSFYSVIGSTLSTVEFRLSEPIGTGTRSD